VKTLELVLVLLVNLQTGERAGGRGVVALETQGDAAEGNPE
jgi:hypothetical protein